jgi:hypothetical protein
MPTTHAYTTTVTSGDGQFAAEVISIPRYFRGEVDPLGALAEELGVRRAAPVAEWHLRDMLTQLAYETGAGKRASPMAVEEVVKAVTDEPIVVVERSPSVGSSLAGLLSQGAPAYVMVAEQKPFMAAAIEAGLVVVWFLSGPVGGAREAAHDATKTVMTEYLERRLREIFSPRRRRGRSP